MSAPAQASSGSNGLGGTLWVREREEERKRKVNCELLLLLAAAEKRWRLCRLCVGPAAAVVSCH